MRRILGPPLLLVALLAFASLATHADLVTDDAPALVSLDVDDCPALEAVAVPSFDLAAPASTSHVAIAPAFYETPAIVAQASERVDRPERSNRAGLPDREADDDPHARAVGYVPRVDYRLRC